MNYVRSNQNIQTPDSSIHSEETDDGYDMVRGAKITPQLVLEFLTGRQMESQTHKLQAHLQILSTALQRC